MASESVRGFSTRSKIESPSRHVCARCFRTWLHGQERCIDCGSCLKQPRKMPGSQKRADPK